jgi:hypothetical protein
VCNITGLLDLVTEPFDKLDAVLVMLLQVPLLPEVNVREERYLLD